MCPIRREMKPLKGCFEAIPYVGNKLFPSFGKNRKIEKKNLFLEKILFLKKVSTFGKFLFLEKIFSIFGKNILNLKLIFF